MFSSDEIGCNFAQGCFFYIEKGDIDGLETNTRVVLQ